MDEVPILLDQPDRLVNQRQAIIEHPEGHKTLNEGELEFRAEHSVTHRLELFQAASQILNRCYRVAAAKRQRTFVAARDGEIRSQRMIFSV